MRHFGESKRQWGVQFVRMRNKVEERHIVNLRTSRMLLSSSKEKNLIDFDNLKQ
jgi:hypothetical protein